MRLSHALFRYLRKENLLVGTRMSMMDTLAVLIEQQAKDSEEEREKRREGREDERAGGGGEGDQVKKSSSFVRQSFFNDTLVIRIYIH